MKIYKERKEASTKYIVQLVLGLTAEELRDLYALGIRQFDSCGVDLGTRQLIASAVREVQDDVQGE